MAGVRGLLLAGVSFVVPRMEAQVDWGGARDGGVQSDWALLTWNVKGIVSTGLMCLPVCYLCQEGCVLTMLVVLTNFSSWGWPRPCLS